MGVVGVDSVVVEGWASCFVVGLVLGLGQGGYFGELVLAPVGLPGDLNRIVRQFRFEVEPPIQHAALSFAGSAAVGSGEQFELGVDAAFQAVGGGFDPLGRKDSCWRVEVDKQHLGPPKMVEAVVGLAHVVMRPHADQCTGFGVFDQGFSRPSMTGRSWRIRAVAHPMRLPRPGW